MTRTSIATDDFNRASLGSNWAQLGSSYGNIQTYTSLYMSGEFSVQPTNQISAARWVGAGSFTDDQYSSLVLTNIYSAGSDARMGVIVRASSDTNANRDYYQLSVRGDSATTPLTTLAKWVNGTETILYEAAVSWSAGDRIELEVQGTTLRACKNGSPLGGSWTVTDSSISTGLPGVAAAATGIAFRGDDWIGGNLTTTAPVLSGGTLSNITSTSADVGVSIDVASSTLYRYRSTNSTESAATIKASGTTSTVTASGAQGPFSTTGMTTKGTYYVHFVANDGTTDSNVVSVGPIYPGTWRPASDITVTGWTVTGAATHAAAMTEDESVADGTKDASYDDSPTLTTTYQGKILALDRSMPAGTYQLEIRNKLSSGSGFCRVRVLDGSNAEMGTTGDIAINSSMTTYTATLVVTGTATRITDEYKI